MKTLESYFLSSLCMLIFIFGRGLAQLTSSASPQLQITTEATTIRVEEGSTAVLKCRVANLESHTVSWTFVTHDLRIFHGRERVINDPVKYSLISPLDTSAYDLMILGVEKSDHGFYRCAIDGTDLSVTILVEVEGKPLVPFSPPTLNRTDCCVDAGVDASCVPACSLSDLDITSFDIENNCGGNIAANAFGLTHCLTANSNHDNCCLFHGLHPMCIPFCHNEIPPELTANHTDNCLTQESLTILVQCFSLGFESLPDAPREVSVLPSTTENSVSLVVSWEPPERNPDKVTGYKIMYRREDQLIFYAHVVNDRNAKRYRLTRPNIIANLQYHVYVAALADQGVSLGSVEVTVFIPDESLSQTQNQLMSACCADREVSPACNSLLCRSRTWAHFNFDSLAECFPSMDDIFSCLVGERDHTPCCQSFGVSSVCQPLCSGHPPPFNESLIICTHEFGIVEACVQQGYDELPTPPNNLRLADVTSVSATLTFMNSSSPTEIQYYQVELHEGLDEEKNFQPFLVLSRESLSLFLEPLKPNTYYGVRITTINSQNFGSLPSDTVFFLTYPSSFEEPTPPPVVNVPNDFKGCCVSKGMPTECSDGCRYLPNITSHFLPVIDLCYSHIGSVLSCASDGRDHSPCCEKRGVTNEVCLDLCRINTDGPLPAAAAQNCIPATPIAVECFIEGVVYLPRYPEVVVSNVTWHSISLTWVHPPTSSLIDTYIIEYGVASESEKIQKTTNKTQYIINDLKPATEYEITVSSRNSNGTSVPSPLIRQYTLQEKSKFPELNESRPTGNQLWSNISDCCKNSGIPLECLDLCLNKEVQSPNSSCILYSHNTLSCYSDGQDHSLCCSRKPELPEACYSLCEGQTQDSNPSVASCMSYGNFEAILSCFLENSDLIPEAPSHMSVEVKTATSIQVKWIKPDAFCGSDCHSIINYWKFDPENPDVRNVMTKKNVESPHVIENLDTESFYTFTVRAENSHGVGPPSSLETIFLSSFRREVKVTLRKNEPYVEVGQDATLQCAAFDFNPNDPYTLEWYFNNGREIKPAGPNKSNLVLMNVDPIRDEGTYSCIVTDSAQTNSDDIFLPIKYTPSGAHIKDGTVQANQGQQAILECGFKGIPDTDADHWQKDGVALQANPTKYSAIVDRSKQSLTGITTYRLKVADVKETDYGDYSIKVSNHYGSTGCTVKMQDPDAIIDIIPAVKVFNGTECCVNSGVTELCLDICSFDIDIEEIIEDSKYITCLAHFEVYIQCGADGRDHTTCCRNKGINPYCIPFCAGQSPANVITEQDELLQCVAESSKIFECAQSGHDILPFPPRNIVVRWWASSRNVMVRWSRPLHNYHHIEHYFVHYRAGNGPEQTHMVNEQIQEYEIVNADKEKEYTVYVTARNQFGSSQSSDLAILEAIAVPAPSNVDAVVTGNEVTLTWADTQASSPSFDSYNVYYKKMSDARYTKIDGITQSTYKLTGLEENTNYIAYVTTQSVKGHESAPSMHKQFRSGSDASPSASQGKGDDNDEVAIAVGVVVAVFAVAAIVFLVIYLVKSRRMNKYTNDTVAFENRAYENQGGSVKIQGMESDDQFNYGRLDEESVYDNPAETATEEPPGAYANPTYVGEGNEDTNVATLPVNDNV